MKVTVCQMNPFDGQRDDHLKALKTHLKAAKSDFLLLPEMCFSNWLASSPNPDPQVWRDAVVSHQDNIKNLSKLGVNFIVGTRPRVAKNNDWHNQAFLWNAETNTAQEWQFFWKASDS